MRNAQPCNRRTALRYVGAGAATLAGAPLLAQEDKSPITILVGAATTMDATARIFAEQLKDALGRPVIVQSRLGAGGRIAAAELKRAAPDGKTLMVAASSIFTIYPNIYTKLEYDPVADFTPVAGLTWFDVALATGPATNAADLKQLLAWARSKQDLTFGASPGSGSSSHFAGIAIGIAAGVKTTFVPYKEGPPAMADVVTGRLPSFITGTGTLAELHKAGQLRIVATSGADRSPLTPEVPTFKEAGIDVTIINTTGLYAPARMPRALVDRVHAALAPIYAKADLPARLLAQGMAPRFTTGPQLATSLEMDRKHYAGLVKASGFVPETQ